MASNSPVTTIGGTAVGPWNSVVAHYKNTAGVRAYVASGTELTAAGSLEFLPFAGLRESWWYFDAVADGDTWDSTSSGAKPPYGMVSAAWSARAATDANDMIGARLTGPRSVRFSTAGAGTGGGWLVVWSRG